MSLGCSNFEASGGGGGTRHPGTVPPLAQSRHLEGGTPGHRPPSTYLWYVVAHPGNLLFLGTFLLASVVGANLWMLAATFALEAVLLSLAPQVPWLRRNVDRQLRARERRDAAAVRSNLAAHMSPERRGELVELEGRVETIRTNAGRAGRHADGILDDLVGLDRLLGSFTRLAVIQRATLESLEMTDRAVLVGEIEHLEHQLRASSSVRLREAIARRLSLARRRLEFVDRNRHRLLAMDHQLSTIGEMIRLVHEQSVALMEAGDAAEMVERVMFELEQHEEALAEIVAVCAPEDELLDQLEEAEEPETEPSSEEIRVARRARVAY